MPTQTFTNGDDTFTVSSAGNYTLDFLAGNDRLNVYGGDSVTAHLGDGDDLAIIKAALVSIFGDAGADRFDIYATNSAVDGGTDADTINIRGGSGQTAHGGIGNDRFNFYADGVGVSLFGDDGNDDFFGYNHQVTGTLSGGLGSDYFAGFTAGVTLAGGAGNDIYRATVGSLASFMENSAEGIDAVQVARGQDYTLPDNIENISVQGFSGSDLTSAILTGNALNNRIVGHNNDEMLFGLDGNDFLSGKGGSDVFDGGDGNDTLDGGSGNDTLHAASGDDILQGRTGDDSMDGGLGDDTYYIDSASDSVFELAGGGTDTIRVSVSYNLTANVENAIVQSGAGGLSINDLAGINNVIIGNSGNDNFGGNQGNDVLKGGGGDDLLYGGTGVDTMYGGTGNDLMYVDNLSDVVVEMAGEGNDSVTVSVSGYTLAGNVEIGYLVTTGGAGMSLSGNFGDNYLYGNVGDDVLNGGFGDDRVYADDGADSVGGGPGSDILYGYGGADYLSGGDGDDFLSGDDGEDTLTGDDGTDELRGGLGVDHLTGGGGADTFTYISVQDSPSGDLVRTWDNITDFDTASDVINLSAIDANSILPGNQAFNTNGTSTNTAGDLWIASYGGIGSFNNYMIYGDVDGDGNADFQVLVHLASGTSDQINIVH